MRKKFWLMGLVMILTFTLVSCTKDKSEKANDDKSSTEVSEEGTKPSENAEAEDSSKDKDTSSDSKESKKENCRLFFFDTEKLEEVYVDKEIEIVGGAKVNALTKAHQEFKDNKKLLSLTDKAKVKSAKVDGDILKVYFDKDFTKEMTLGTATESGLIQSLVDTYGYNYKIKKVAIYVNNELYTGLRGELPEGYYEVKASEAKAYK